MTLIRRLWLGFARLPKMQTLPMLLLLILFLSALFLLKGRINGDGFSYYAWLRSPLFDGDLSFLNEYTEFNPQGYWTAVNEVTATGLRANPFAIGPALLWVPWMAIAWMLTTVLGPTLGLPNDGYSFFYTLLIPLGSLVYASIGAMLLYASLRRYFDKGIVFITSLGILYATPLLNYLFNEATSSHTLSFFVISLFYWYWLRSDRFNEDSDNVLGGLIAGLMVLVRWQQVIFLLPVWVDKLFRSRRPMQVVYLTLPVVGVASLQLIAWKLVYGSFFTLPQTGAYFIPPTDVLTWLMQLPKLWFSPNHGLFYWTPLVLVAVGGLWFFRKKEPYLAAAFACVFLLSSLVNSLVWEYYGGWAFGSRRMIETLPLLAFGLAAFWTQLRHQWVALAITLGAVGWTVMLWLQYRVGSITPTGALVFPEWISSQFSQLLPGARTVLGQSVLGSEAYYYLQTGGVHLWLLLAALLCIVAAFGLLLVFLYSLRRALT